MAKNSTKATIMKWFSVLFGVKGRKILYKRRNGYISKLFRSWLVVLFILILIISIYFYIRSHNFTSPLYPKPIHQLTKDIYQNEKLFSTKDIQFKFRNYCEVIHIGVVCSGFNSNVYFHALLKSLFLTRINPIHFHLLVSNESETVLRLLFKTWQIPQVKISFYNIKNWLKDVRWVPNNHYSGNYGLLKLIFSKVVPVNETKKLLILDTDLIINGDIFMLWKLFEEFNYNQALGIVENQSPYYLGKLSKSNPWPAIGTGFNSGVMLYDLEKLNAMKWDTLWVNLTKRLTLVYGHAELGDQDIINSLIVESPDILFKLPCYWNTQMSDNSLSSSCYKEHKPMIVHWNSPKKFDVPTKDGEKFRGLAKTVFELNGNWFRTSPQMCEDDTQIALASNVNEECQKFRKSPDVLYRTLLFFRDYKYVAEDCDITYVTHLSFDRIGLLEDIVKIWTGPISFTLYVTDAELLKTIQIIMESELLRDRSDISYHAVFKEGDFYPINTLRNAGLKHVNTPFVFLTDIDFIPMKSLFEILKDNIRSMRDLNKKALIVPAFEVTHSSVIPPKSKIQLIEALDKKEVRPFLAEVWAAGHVPTDYEKWRKELEPYQVKWKTNYEPYIVVKSNVVEYDERFLGFGWNKVSHIMELEAQDYEFIVLSDVFIIHQPHTTSCDNMRYKKSAIYRQCLQSLKNKFVQELHRKYNKTYTDLNYSDDINDIFNKRRKRNSDQDSTTTLYDSTDYFLVWGGKEKAEGKKEPRKSFRKESDHVSRSLESPKEIDYYYYESEYPYNLTVFKLKPNEIFKAVGVNVKHINFTSSEEHDYEYSEEDLKFKIMHDSTTEADFVDNSTVLIDAHVVEHEKIYESVPVVDEKLKNIPVT